MFIEDMPKEQIIAALSERIKQKRQLINETVK